MSKQPTQTFVVRRTASGTSWVRRLAGSVAMLVGGAGSALAAPVAAATPAAAQELRPFTVPLDQGFIAERTRFGSAVAVGRRVAIVGAPGDSLRGTEAGSVYVYERDAVSGAYTRTQTLQPLGVGPYDRFGAAVAVFRNILVVGAKGDDAAAPNAGAAYVFIRADVDEPFEFAAKLTPPSAGSSDCFGVSVAVLLNRVAIGAPRTDAGGLDKGAVYVYDVDTGTNTVTLDSVVTDPNGGIGDGLGTSVAVFQDTLYTGAERYNAPSGPINVGAVLVFERSSGGTWAVTETLTSSVAVTGSRFGASLAIEPPRPGFPGTLFVGAPDAPRAGQVTPRGLVTIFQATVGTPWSETYNYGLDDDNTGSSRGISVAMQNGVALAGAPGRDEERGAVDVFTRSAQGAWSFSREIVIPDSDTEDRVGLAVAFLNEAPLIGVPGRDGSAGDDEGRAWLSSALWAGLGEADCTPSNVNSTGVAACIAARGSQLADDDDLTLEAGFLPAFTFGLALVSANQGFVANAGGSEGNLCLSGAIGRVNSAITLSDAGGRLEIPIDTDALPLPTGFEPIQAGDTWWFQIWYRDFIGVPTSNYTSTVGIRFE